MTNLTWITGFPRMGENRELKKALEQYWAGKINKLELQKTASELRLRHWNDQRLRGIDCISCGDFSLYDNMLDTAVMVNAVPERFRSISNPLEQYFAMARGTAKVPAMEMTKWFNTNYHFIVPELDDSIEFKPDSRRIEYEYREAVQAGIMPKINLIGPLTFLSLSRVPDGCSAFDYLDSLLPVYRALLDQISSWGDDILVQIDEPVLVKNPGDDLLSALKTVYRNLSRNSGIRIVIATYFEHAVEAVKVLEGVPVWGIALDFLHGPDNLDALKYMGNKKLIAGVIDGRNIWKTDLDAGRELLCRIGELVPRDQIIISSSCSLLHCPYSAANEPDSPVKKWFSFALEKLDETVLLGRLFQGVALSAREEDALEKSRKALQARRDHKDILRQDVRERVNREGSMVREGSFAERSALQRQQLGLTELPTTTIGSFPQTEELRKIRRLFKNGDFSPLDYEAYIKKYIDDCVAFQEEAGLDVLVHGEPERNDMVEYFGEQLDGFHFTKGGWVQSYGSRCVKPPVIYGDISRPKPMTTKWIAYAQSKTEKIVKGMLTGPVTIINWSFVRDDLSRSEIAFQIALALRDEIRDLQKEGIQIIQVDEAAFKEGYPLRTGDVSDYEKWAVDSFKLTVSSAEKETQIHTHMCYSNFNDIMSTIEAMDADVITIETARSGNRLLNIFAETGYANEIGPGVYDIHSPRIPDVAEQEDQIRDRLKVLDRNKMWVNPDCGLKTRKWEEVKPALVNMVEAVKRVRESVV